MKVIAHRGACTEALENSWQAFRLAVDSAADRIELDVHLTRDGHLAVMHDETCQRTAGDSRRINQLTRAEISRDIQLANGEPVPFLDEVLAELLPTIEFNIEVKSPGRPTVTALAQLLEQQPHPEKLIVSSFLKPTCEQLAREHPEIKVALLWDRSLWWPGAFRWGPRQFMAKNAIRIFHPEARLVTPSMVQLLKLEGWDIFPYVGLRDEAHPEELWTYLMTVGVDGLCTNYPRHMRLWLQEVEDDPKRFRNLRLESGNA